MPIVSAEMTFKDCQKLIQVAFPGVKSRRVVPIKLQDSYRVHDYWDGGSRYEARFVNIFDPFGFHAITRSALGNSAGPNQLQGNPYNQDIYEVVLDNSFAVIEHVISSGKDLGYRIYLHPSLLETYRQRIIDKG